MSDYPMGNAKLAQVAGAMTQAVSTHPGIQGAPRAPITTEVSELRMSLDILRKEYHESVQFFSEKIQRLEQIIGC